MNAGAKKGLIMGDDDTVFLTMASTSVIDYRARPRSTFLLHCFNCERDNILMRFVLYNSLELKVSLNEVIWSFNSKVTFAFIIEYSGSIF